MDLVKSHQVTSSWQIGSERYKLTCNKLLSYLRRRVRRKNTKALMLLYQAYLFSWPSLHALALIYKKDSNLQATIVAQLFIIHQVNCSVSTHNVIEIGAASNAHSSIAAVTLKNFDPIRNDFMAENVQQLLWRLGCCNKRRRSTATSAVNTTNNHWNKFWRLLADDDDATTATTRLRFESTKTSCSVTPNEQIVHRLRSLHVHLKSWSHSDHNLPSYLKTEIKIMFARIIFLCCHIFADTNNCSLMAVIFVTLIQFNFIF